MRTTLDLVDDLGTEIKILAAQEKRTLKELVAELLRAGLKSRQQAQTLPHSLPVPYRSQLRLDRQGLQEILRGRHMDREVGR
jgi:hypothetical protein